MSDIIVYHSNATASYNRMLSVAPIQVRMLATALIGYHKCSHRYWTSRSKQVVHMYTIHKLMEQIGVTAYHFVVDGQQVSNISATQTEALAKQPPQTAQSADDFYKVLKADINAMPLVKKDRVEYQLMSSRDRRELSNGVKITHNAKPVIDQETEMSGWLPPE